MHFDVICDLLLNRRMATWNLFVKCYFLNIVVGQLILKYYNTLEFHYINRKLMVQIVLDNTVKKYIYKKRGESANSVGNMY